MAVNNKRVVLGAIAGGVVWTLWTLIINSFILGERYASAQSAGLLLKEPRYKLFPAYWIVTMFLCAWVVSWLYASARATRGAGPKTALKIGLLVGFAAGFPMNLPLATFLPLDRFFPLWWMLELWVGAVLASLVAGALYKD